MNLRSVSIASKVQFRHAPKSQAKRWDLFGLITSPAAALALTLMGYYSFAGFTNALFPEGSLGGILIRLGTISIVVLALLHSKGRYMSPLVIAFLPISLFFIGYLLRLIENFYFSDVEIPPGPTLILATFTLSTILPAFLLVRVARQISDDDFLIVGAVLSILFIAGMALNLEALTETVDDRLMLEKINPISMAHTAFGFVLFYMLYFSKSKRLMLLAGVIVPVLLLVVVYARSRGAYISGAGTIVIYLLLLKGTRRIAMLLGIATAGALFLLFASGEIIDIVSKSIERIDIYQDQSTYLHYIAVDGAWRQFMDDFFFGRYAVELVTGYYPHNIYLESLMAVGLIGSIPFGIHLVLVGRAVVGIIRSQKFPTVATFACVILLRESIACGVSGAVWASTSFWVSSVIVLTFWYSSRINVRRKVWVFSHPSWAPR